MASLDPPSRHESAMSTEPMTAASIRTSTAPSSDPTPSSNPTPSSDPTPINSAGTQADFLEEEGQDWEHKGVNVSELSEREQDRASNFKQLLDPTESGPAHRKQKDWNKRETAKKKQIESKRGDVIDPYNISRDGIYFQQDPPLHQEDLSSKCVEEAGQFIEKLGEQMQIDLSKIMHAPSYDYDDSLSIDSELWLNVNVKPTKEWGV